jgi:spore germination cell wall hydrolase CwlJ-like protein
MLRILIFFTILIFLPFSIGGNSLNQYWNPEAFSIKRAHTDAMPPMLMISKENFQLNVDQVDPIELECMSKNIYFEASTESTAGKIAVGQVVLNRKDSISFPNTVCDVIYEGKHYKSGFPVRDRCQFSWYCDGKHDRPFRGKLWENSVELAKFLLETDDLVDITDGATFYHADYISAPRWTTTKIKTVTIDRHIFYSSRRM